MQPHQVNPLSPFYGFQQTYPMAPHGPQPVPHTGRAHHPLHEQHQTMVGPRSVKTDRAPQGLNLASYRYHRCGPNLFSSLALQDEKVLAASEFGAPRKFTDPDPIVDIRNHERGIEASQQRRLDEQGRTRQKTYVGVRWTAIQPPLYSPQAEGQQYGLNPARYHRPIPRGDKQHQQS